MQKFTSGSGRKHVSYPKNGVAVHVTVHNPDGIWKTESDKAIKLLAEADWFAQPAGDDSEYNIVLWAQTTTQIEEWCYNRQYRLGDEGHTITFPEI